MINLDEQFKAATTSLVLLLKIFDTVLKFCDHYGPLKLTYRRD